MARHGQTTSDVEGRFGGAYDDSHTSKGIAQNHELASALLVNEAKLKDEAEEKAKSEGKDPDETGFYRVERHYPGPQVRHRESQRIVAEHTAQNDEAPLTGLIVEDFRERNAFGVLTGMTKEEAAAAYPDQLTLVHDMDQTIEGAEAREIFTERVLRAWGSIVDKPFKSVMIFTSAGPIHTICREVLGIEVEIDDCGLLRVEHLKNSQGVVTVDYELVSGIRMANGS